MSEGAQTKRAIAIVAGMAAVAALLLVAILTTGPPAGDTASPGTALPG